LVGWLKPGNRAQFRRAHGREVFGMGKQDCPAIADPFVKADCALRGLGREVGRRLINQRHCAEFRSQSRCSWFHFS
jgi:hypothetical protein